MQTCRTAREQVLLRGKPEHSQRLYEQAAGRSETEGDRARLVRLRRWYQPGLPMKKGRAGTMTHDYKRHGTTTLFAALNVLDGTVIGRNMQRHRHQEFIGFLNAIEAAVPAGNRSTPSSTTTPPTSTRRSARGSIAIPAGPSTSCRHPAPGSTPSRASSPSSRSGASSAASSTPSSTSRPPSTASSTSITQNRGPSPGPPIRTGSSQPSGAGTKCWILSTRSSRDRQVFDYSEEFQHGQAQARSRDRKRPAEPVRGPSRPVDY